ncbi:MAG: family 16 glycosylhydrolase [Bacteroidales bacterium]
MKFIHSKIAIGFLLLISNVHIAYNQLASNESVGLSSANYKLVWQDNFDGPQLDEVNNWSVEVNGNGGGNNELQYYRRENLSVGLEPVSGQNCLIITAKKESFSGKTCTSGRLTTSGKMSFKHGKIEARIKLPKTANGLWPAFWMMGADYPSVGWPKCGEIDILEMGNANGISKGTQDKYFNGACHWGESWNGGSYPNYAKATTNSYSIQDDFHLFTLIWDDNALKMYLDLDKYPTVSPYYEMAINQVDVAPNPSHYFHKKDYVILNLAIGGNFTGISNINNVTALNNGDAKMYVDYVKVYQQGIAGEEYTGPVLSSINHLKVQNQFQVYPNPGLNRINVVSSSTINKITVINIQGQHVISISYSNSIDISNLSDGNYLIKIEDTTGKTETHKFTKK